MHVFLLTEAWQAVIDKVQDARLGAGLKPLSFSGKSLRVFHFSYFYVVLSQYRLFFYGSFFSAPTCISQRKAGGDLA